MSKADTKMPAGAALSPFDAAKYLHTPEEIATFLEAVFEDYDGDTRVIVKALGVVAKAQGMPSVAKATGMSREGLYQALSGKGNPSFDTMLKVMSAVGIELRPKAKAVKRIKARTRKAA
ncbi:MAG: addiction module antidote protein [Pseudomonadota bacterium]